jgi:uncharacterized NAD(P)/FAD-binding protein YdhS
VEAARRELRFGIRPHAITPDTTADRSVVIVGGGAAGTLTAVHLLRAGAPGRVVVVEREDRLARGVAYSTTFPRHLMNVVAANLGGISGRPEHLLEWLAEQGDPVAPGDFVSRMTFGRYLSDLLAQADAAAPGVLETVRGAVVDVAREDDRARVALADGRTLAAAHVVLATGTPTSGDVPVAGGWPPDSPRYVHDPWTPGALGRLAPGDDLLLVGTGLTMVDVALRLVAERPDVRLVGLSRTGLLPIPHRWPQGPVDLGHRPPPAGTSLRVQVRAFRAAMRAAAGRGGDARDVVDAMRPYTQAIWEGFSPAEQRRALRTYTRVWAINRNRMAPAAAHWVESLRAGGRLTIVTGAVVAAEDAGGRLRVHLRRRGEAPTEAWEFDAAVNCVGPADAPFGAGSPLYDRLLAAGLVRPHPLGLGLDTGPGGAVRNAAGELSEAIFTIGWMRRGELWESVAIPELRDQSAELAARFTLV